MGDNGKKKETTTTTTAPSGFLHTVGNFFMPKNAQERIAKNKEAESFGDEKPKSGNPLHYQTHVNDAKKNRQGARKGVTLHHRNG
jgi:hypothetical protein